MITIANCIMGVLGVIIIIGFINLVSYRNPISGKREFWD